MSRASRAGAISAARRATIADGFAGSAAVLSSTPDGHSWSFISAATISKDGSGRAATTASGASEALVDTGSSNGLVQCTFFSGANAGREMRIVLSSDATGANQYLLDFGPTIGFYIGKRVSNSLSTITANGALTPAANTVYTLMLTKSGTSLKAYLNGTLQLSATDSAVAANSRSGFANFFTDQWADNFTARRA